MFGQECIVSSKVLHQTVPSKKKKKKASKNNKISTNLEYKPVEKITKGILTLIAIL